MLNRLNNNLAAQIQDLFRAHLLFAIARSVIAAGQISVLLFTPASALFVPVGEDQPLARCERAILTVSPYCWFPESAQLVNVAVIVILAVVATGFMPQIAGFVHAWITFSFSQLVSLPDGGEHVAQVVSILFIFVSLSHNRLWYWKAPLPRDPNSILAAVSLGAWWAIRLQMAWVYLHSSIAKTAVGEWQDGSAVYYVVRQEMFGSSGIMRELILWSTSIGVISLMLTWGTIVIESAMAILILMPRRIPAIAWVLCLLLHLGIIFVLGLFSFGTIMIGCVLAATAPAVASVFRSYSRTKVARSGTPQYSQS